MFNVNNETYFRWTITAVVSGDDVDFHFGHIEGEPEWSRNIPGRIAIDPCSGARTLIMRSDGGVPKRRGSLTMHFGTENNQTPDQNLEDALALFAAGGPYTLKMPTGRTISFVFDMESEWRERRFVDKGHRVTIGIAEV